MRKFTVVMCVFAMLAFLGSNNAMANVFASKVIFSIDSVDVSAAGSSTISFALNEHARLGVDVKIYNTSDELVRTLNIENGVQGENNVVWDGKDDGGAFLPNGDYSVTVTPADSGYTVWTTLSPDTMTNILYKPFGVAVNKNLDSPYFGRIYVTNGYDTTGWDFRGEMRDFPRGVFLFDADQSYISNEAAETAWNDGSSASPARLMVGADDQVYVGDFGNDIGWQFDENVSIDSEIQLFDETNRDEGQWMASFWVDGTGVDRMIYTADGHYGAYTGIKAYAIGEDEFVDGLGDTVIHRPSGSFYQYDVEVDSEGSIYFCEFRWGANQAYALIKYPSHAGVDTAYTIDDTLWTADKNKWTGAYGIGLDEPRGLAAYAHYYDGQIVLFDMNTGAFVDTVTGITSRPRDLCFDAVGNLYTVDDINKRWVVASPGHGENSFTTPALSTIKIINGTAIGNRDQIVSKFELSQNYPNPFNPATEIKFSLKNAGFTTLTVYNVLGQKVSALVSEDLKAGAHKVTFDATSLASGIYIYKLQSNGRTITKKMNLLK